MKRAVPTSPHGLDIPGKITLAVVAVAWLAVVMGGGSSRPDVPHLLVVRLMAVVGLAVVLVMGSPERLRFQRGPLLFFGGAVALIAVQLVPLPFSVWSWLPGREPYARLSHISELGEIWRPISLSPDLTWNSLLALVPPALFLIAIPTFTPKAWQWLLTVLLGTIILSAVLGLLQVAGGPETALRHYQFTNRDAGVGFFANRNHQATFLAMGIPLAIWWATSKQGAMRLGARLAIAGSIILFLLTSIIATQSRMGVLIATLALLISGIYVVGRIKLERRLLAWICLTVAGGILAAGVALSKWTGGRLDPASAGEDLRIRILPESLEAAHAFFPVGSGFGTFPHVFPRFEGVEDLGPAYVNHTHSELTQLPIEGGLVAILLLMLFLAWYIIATVRAWRTDPAEDNAKVADARLCSILMVLPLIASVTDYPLRTPLMACTFTGAAIMLHVLTRRQAS